MTGDRVDQVIGRLRDDLNRLEPGERVRALEALHAILVEGHRLVEVDRALGAFGEQHPPR